MSTGFEQLHPSIRHHIVNTLGWNDLRPLQAETIEPIRSDQHALLLAPTAGGKTEAAAFPIFSRMAQEEWAPLSVLYLAPLRALLNNLLPRLELYGSFVGRRVGLWHGDTSPGERNRMMVDPPDLLLTTPESLEAMLISRRVNERWLFPHLRAVVIDEVHAFAAADRGWHLLAVLERLSRIAGRDLQRIGLSATVGNPEELLQWLCGSSQGPHRVVAPAAETIAEPEVTLDYVGSLDNAAVVINRLHRGEKRLVFVDSRRRAEELAVKLRGLDTTTFVSHGSLGRDERRRSEQAFAEATDCVIVATSTLELGIDVGDLDRVIQIDSPTTVAGFLQRIGRTGRRPGSSRNALFLTTSSDALLTAAGLLHLWSNGYVEPAVPPVMPAHLVAQQILALTLQEAEDGLPLSQWSQWLGHPPVLGREAMDRADEVVAHLLATDWLHADGGLLSPGQRAEQTIGRRNFLELMSVFVSDPIHSVRHGRVEIGQVPDVAITAAFSIKVGAPSLLLAGRAWKILSVDWKRRITHVEPGDDIGRVRFAGSSQPLSYDLCQSMASVLAGTNPDSVRLTERGAEALDNLRYELPGMRPGRSRLVHRDGRTTLYTFGGLRVNLELAARLTKLRSQTTQRDNLAINLDANVSLSEVSTALSQPTPVSEMRQLVDDVSSALTLQDALPQDLVGDILVARLRESENAERVARSTVDQMTR